RGDCLDVAAPHRVEPALGEFPGLSHGLLLVWGADGTRGSRRGQGAGVTPIGAGGGLPPGPGRAPHPPPRPAPFWGGRTTVAMHAGTAWSAPAGGPRPLLRRTGRRPGSDGPPPGGGPGSG